MCGKSKTVPRISITSMVIMVKMFLVNVGLKLILMCVKAMIMKSIIVGSNLP